MERSETSKQAQPRAFGCAGLDLRLAIWAAGGGLRDTDWMLDGN